jgi:hypothetical protein
LIVFKTLRSRGIIRTSTPQLEWEYHKLRRENPMNEGQEAKWLYAKGLELAVKIGRRIIVSSEELKCKEKT